MDNILDNKDFVLDDLNPASVSKKIAERMKRRRLFLNISQEQLSKRSGVSLGSLKRFENKYQISLKHLLQLAMVLDAMNEFHGLFPENRFNSIDDVLKSKNTKERKRARDEKKH